MKKLRCVLYARVSTKKERGLQNPETQLRQLREFAVSQNWDVTAEFIDHEGGSKADRPEFLRMMEAAAKRQFDILLFWSVDRFSREGIVPVLTNLKRLSGYGVRYRSYQEPFIDTTSEFGDLLAAFVAKIAELERKRIRARINAGLERARAKGVKLGRKRLVFDRSKVWKMRDSGKSIREISESLRLSHGTVQRVIQDRG
jgi:DNA invertase Pin-like site-specific DNA recombinase